MKAIGLDIGTTTICGVVVDGVTGEVLFSRTLPNDSFLKSDYEYEKIQDPEKIWMKICQILNEMAPEHPEAVSIGLTGQMHGILYVDGNGNAVSPLYTWQDESGNCVQEDGKTYAEILNKKTGYPAAYGYGMTTYYFHQMNGLVPKNAEKICTIGDYIALKLTGEKLPMMTVSNAASLGLFDLERCCFDQEAMRKAGISESMLPAIVTGAAKVGEVSELGAAFSVYAKVPVSAAIGDNQASVIGTVKEPEKTVLVNVGTGSQISVGSRKYVGNTEAELRPLFSDDYIFVGACLCGGRAYAALEQFFRKVAEMAFPYVKTERLYDKMEKLLNETHDEIADQLSVKPQFCGTRKNPELRGAVTGISLDNLTPQSMIRGFLHGIAGELFEMYQEIMPSLEEKPVYLVGSGNGIRMNRALQEIFERMFSMPLQIPVHTEEAAYGTALVSMVAAGKKSSLQEAQSLIHHL